MLEASFCKVSIIVPDCQHSTLHLPTNEPRVEYTSAMKMILIRVVLFAVVLAVLFYALNTYIYTEKQARSPLPPAPTVSDYKDADYQIDGTVVHLSHGVSETEAAPGSASKITTRYFGNEYKTDLNHDGREDVVFLLTQETGGSGTFYYVVAALNTEQGYVGSDGYLLGDRIAPQSTGPSQSPRHKDVVVVNYAERAAGEPVTTPPSVGRSAYLKLDIASMQWGIVEPDFEGESR